MLRMVTMSMARARAGPSTSSAATVASMVSVFRYCSCQLSARHTSTAEMLTAVCCLEHKRSPDQLTVNTGRSVSKHEADAGCIYTIYTI